MAFLGFKKRKEEYIGVIERITPRYKEYLKTDWWKDKRRETFKRHKGFCYVCGASNVKMNTHHCSYERKGNENKTDLILVCEKCHNSIHNRVNSKIVKLEKAHVFIKKERELEEEKRS